MFFIKLTNKCLLMIKHANSGHVVCNFLRLHAKRLTGAKGGVDSTIEMRTLHVLLSLWRQQENAKMPGVFSRWVGQLTAHSGFDKMFHNFLGFIDFFIAAIS